ncbi:unnamed protein product [Pylaiella littoralis]
MKHGRQDLRGKVRGVVLQAPVSDRENLATLPGTESLIEEAKTRRGGEDLMPVAADEAPITAARFLSLATKEGDDDMFSADLSSEERHSRLGHMASVPTAAFLSGADQFVPPLPPVPEGGGGGGGGGRSPVEALAATFRAAMIGSSSSAAFSTASRTPDDAASPAASCAAAIGSSSDSCARGTKEDTAASAGAAAAAAAAAKTVAFVIDGADHALSDPVHALEFTAKVEAFVAGLE